MRILNSLLLSASLILSFSAIISVCFSASSASAAPLGISKIKQRDQFTSVTSDIPINAFTYNQKLDHWNIFDRRTFTENYWVSPGYSIDENSPVIFYICGETACSPSDVSYMFPWAQLINASVVVIEHRYYGTSQPFTQNTTDNMRWMNMPQALEDFAQIVTYLKREKNMKGPWIVAGGSYSGMLSADFRLTYPHLVRGAWASSAPMHVIDDDQSYDLQMSKDMGDACGNSLRQVVAFAENAVNDPVQFAALRKQFGADTLTDPDDFLFGIADVAAAAVQYRLTNILCNSFKTSDVIADYTAFLQTMANTYGYLPNSYSFSVIGDTTAGGPVSDLRTFFYQQCNEYGLFQTAYQDPKVSVRSQRLNMDYMKKGCERSFGKPFTSGTDVTNSRYFEPMFHSHEASEIYFTNGSLDPWMPLGIAEENGTWKNRKIYASMIAGSSHCDDLSFSRRNKTLALQNAAATLQLLLEKWIK